jgi:type III pantothenate kinase
MVIAIDVGNSSVKVARVSEGDVADITRLPTAGGPDEPALRRLLGTDATPVAVVSVVPAWGVAIRAAAAEGGARRPVITATHRTIPLPVRLPDPGAVGADRLLGAWFARESVGTPLVVVDVGTATTVDVVDAEGAFVGGAILPGPALAMRSLARGTAMLPPVPLVLPRVAIGSDTASAIASGVLFGHVAAIQGLLDRMRAELGGRTRPRVVLTGGDASALGSPDWADRFEPDLLLRGLGALADRTLSDRRLGTPA